MYIFERRVVGYAYVRAYISAQLEIQFFFYHEYARSCIFLYKQMKFFFSFNLRTRFFQRWADARFSQGERGEKYRAQKQKYFASLYIS